MLLAGTTAAVAADGARPTSATSIQQMRLPTALLSQRQIIPRKYFTQALSATPVFETLVNGFL